MTSDFRFTERAESAVARLAKMYGDHPTTTGFVPLLSWISSASENPEILPGPTLAFDELSRIPPQIREQYYEMKNLKLYIALDEKRIAECKSKVLDFRSNRLVLVYPDEV